jgi:hypothetical protein
VVQEVIKRSQRVAEGQPFAKYPHIPRDAADQRRKMKTGEMSRWQSTRCPLAHLRLTRLLLSLAVFTTQFTTQLAIRRPHRGE